MGPLQEQPLGHVSSFMLLCFGVYVLERMHTRVCVQVPKEARRALTLRAGVTGICESPYMVPGKQTLVLMS